MIADVLKLLRAQRGLTQPQLAKELGVSKGNIGDWESNRSKPGFDAIVSLCNYYSISADYLLETNWLPTENETDTKNIHNEKSILHIYKQLEPNAQIEVKHYMLYLLQKGQMTKESELHRGDDGIA